MENPNFGLLEVPLQLLHGNIKRILVTKNSYLFNHWQKLQRINCHLKIWLWEDSWKDMLLFQQLVLLSVFLNLLCLILSGNLIFFWGHSITNFFLFSDINSYHYNQKIANKLKIQRLKGINLNYFLILTFFSSWIKRTLKKFVYYDFSRDCWLNIKRFIFIHIILVL